MTDPVRYWKPLDIDCPTCNAPQGITCRQNGAPINAQHHLARNKVPVLYVCDDCGSLCSMGLLTNDLVHIGKVDDTHSATSTQRRRPSHERQKR